MKYEQDAAEADAERVLISRTV